jgi:hypothetical protein
VKSNEKNAETDSQTSEGELSPSTHAQTSYVLFVQGLTEERLRLTVRRADQLHLGLVECIDQCDESPRLRLLSHRHHRYVF